MNKLSLLSLNFELIEFKPIMNFNDLSKSRINI